MTAKIFKIVAWTLGMTVGVYLITGSWFSLRTEPETQKSEAPELGFPLFRVNQELTELAI